MDVLSFWATGRFRADVSRSLTKKKPIDKFPSNRSKAREAGAKVGEATAEAANEAEEGLANGAITAKIKAKMVLDDLVKARNIHVDTKGFWCR